MTHAFALTVRSAAALDLPRPRSRGPVLVGTAALALFFGGFGAWSAFAPVAEAAIAIGTIKAEGQRRTVQHLEGGIVREILVRDGSGVRAGQVLLRLDDVRSDTALETQRAQRWALLAQDARLGAEQEGTSAIAFPAELLASPELRALDAVTGQRTLFEARAATLDSQVLVLRARVEQQEAAIASFRGQLVATERQHALIRQEEAMRSGLVRQGLARIPELLALQRSRAGLDGQSQDLQGQIDRAQATIAEARQQIRQALDQRLQEVSTERREVRDKIAETEERLRAAADVATRREILAPEAGTVVDLRVFTRGAVVKPGEPVLDLVPEGDRLVAEVEVRPSDIDVVYPGLDAEVRMPAFKQRLVPSLPGRVTWVAADATMDERTRQQHYRAQVLLDREALARHPGVRLVPGMPVEAQIQLGYRSLFRYLAQPLLDSFARAFREQ